MHCAQIHAYAQVHMSKSARVGIKTTCTRLPAIESSFCSKVTALQSRIDRLKLLYALDCMSESNKKKLDVIQMRALRIASGAICGTANSAIQVDMGEPPLQLRRLQQQLQYAAKVILKPHTITQQGKFLKDIGQLSGGNIMKIRLQYTLKYTIFSC